MSELLIRPSHDDHAVLANLMAPNPLDGHRPIDRLVVNAHDAVRSPLLVETAEHSGTPVIIDPLTMLLQSAVDPSDPWVRHVPYAVTDALDPDALGNPFTLEKLVSQIVEFQVERGATAVVAPYFYAVTPDSPAFAASLRAIGLTARKMRADSIRLPIIVVLCAQLQKFARRQGWETALGRFAAAAIDVGPLAIALQLSPLGDGTENYAKLLDAFTAARHLRSAGARVFAWRQGTYGPALIAAGLDGYECGMGIGERTDLARFISQHKPRKSKNGFSAYGVYIPPFGRSVPPKVARVILADRRLRGRLICDSVRCCPRGAESMLASKGRAHAVRARARELHELDEIPNATWRLHHLAKRAASACVLAGHANKLLAQTDLPNRIKTDGYEALEQVLDLIETHGPSAHGPNGARDSA